MEERHVQCLTHAEQRMQRQCEAQKKTKATTQQNRNYWKEIENIARNADSSAATKQESRKRHFQRATITGWLTASCAKMGPRNRQPSEEINYALLNGNEKSWIGAMTSRELAASHCKQTIPAAWWFFCLLRLQPVTQHFQNAFTSGLLLAE